MAKSFSELLALEPRIVFDAAGAVTAVEAVETTDTQSSLEGTDLAVQPDSVESSDDANAEALLDLGGAVKNEILFIDPRVLDAEQLVAGLRDNVQVIWLDPAQDGLAQIGEALSSFDKVDAVHIITHAEDDGLRIGTTMVTANTIDSLKEGFSGWAGALSPDADILFYGCELAKTSQGQDLLDTIASLTGADVAASEDLTGAEALGGDWDLEYNSGDIETGIALTDAAVAEYAHILPAVPQATISGLSDPLIGETIQFTVSFDNTDAVSTGFTPYIDLYLPYLGADGVYNAGTNTYTSAVDGVSLVSATYLGQAVNVTTITLEDNDLGTPGIQFDHPIAVDTAGNPVVMTLDASLGFQEGDQLHVLTLPFGSYTPDQPAADIVITAAVSNLADVGTALNISANAGFELGGDALNNFATDPSILQATTVSTGTSITPQLFRVTNTFSGPEGETATGVNFQRSYGVSVEVALGQTLTNVNVDLTLPEELVYVGTVATGGTVGAAPAQNLAANTTDDIASASYASVTGTQATTYSFYVGEFDQAGASVLNPLTGAAVSIDRGNNISVTGDWTPLDVRDGGLAPVADLSATSTFLAKSIAIQKNVSLQNDVGTAGITPGDTLEYTIDFQISDYFAYDTINVVDDFSDGMVLNAFVPTLDVTRQGVSDTGLTFTLATDYTDTANGDGSHTVSFDVSALMLSTVGIASGVLEGGQFDTDNFAGTQGSITFRTDVQDQYVNVPAGSLFVKQGDDLTNSVSGDGQLLDTALAAVGPIVADGSSADVNVAVGDLTVGIYALNGVTTGTLDEVKPGDVVTFRLQYNLVTGDFENFAVKAFVPLPIFDVSELVGGFVAGPVPLAGEFTWGPNNEAEITGAVVSPTDSFDAASNFITFDLGSFDDVDNDGGQIDILFTLTVTDDPFADGLFLTTFGQSGEDNTPGATSLDPDLQQVKLTEPEISQIIKGVIATNVTGVTTFTPSYTATPDARFKDAGNVDAAPFTGTVNSTNLAAQNMDSDLSNVDAGDLVRFSLVIENTGSSTNGVFDVEFSDVIPAGFVVAGGGINLRVVDGTGAAVGFTYVDGGAATDQAALFGLGLELTDGATGAVAAYDAANGQNIIIVTYDLEVANPVEARTVTTSTATLSNYAGIEGGADHTTVDLTDDATITIAGASIVKTITATDLAYTAGNDVTIGEIITYQVVISLPEGTNTAVQFQDTLDAGMAFVAIDSITPTAGISTNIAGGFPTIQTNAVFANVGGGAANDARLVTMNFGTLTNADTDNTVNDTITVVYRAIVVNVAAATDGATLNNNVAWTATNDSATASAPNVTVQEPNITLSMTPDVAQADAGDTVTWTLVVTAPAGIATDVFEVDLTNVIPAGLTYVGASLSNSAGVAPISLGEAGGTVSASWTSLTPGQTSTLTFQTTIDVGVSFGQSLTNAPVVTWSSIAGGGNTDLEGAGSNTTLDAERTGNVGDPGTTENDYTATVNGTVDIEFATPVLTLDDTSEAANGINATVGEIVRYRIEVQVPESSTTDFRVQPNLPAGLEFLNDGTAVVAFISDGGGVTSSTLLGAGLNIAGDETTVAVSEPTFVLPGGAITGGPFGSGTDPQFLLGNIVNANSDVNQEFIIIEFNAIVRNEASVNDGGSLAVTADMLSGVTNLVTTNSVAVNIVEPALANLVKQVISTDGVTATFEITFNNLSGQTAYDINLSDVLPANLSNLSNVTITPTGTITGTVDNSTGAGLDIDFVSIANGGSLVITYTADITDDTLVAANSNADLIWTNIAGAAATLGTSTAGATGSATGERDDSDGIGGVNDYIQSEAAGLNVISGTLWEDISLDGVVDGGETRLSNIQVDLLWAGKDGVFGNGDDVALNTLTDGTGDYNFGAIAAGDYRLSVKPTGANGIPAGYGSVWDSEGSLTNNLTNLTLAEAVSQANVNFGLQPPNTAPAFAALGGADASLSPTDFDVAHTEGGAAVVLDADALISDAELDAIDNYNGATLTLLRDGGADANDLFSNSGTLGAIAQGNALTVGATTIGAVTTNSGGQLVLTFNGNATTALVNSALQQIAYSYAGDAPPALVTIAYTINDSNAGAQGSGGALADTTGRVVIGITAVNDLPAGADKTVTFDEDTVYSFTIGDFGFTDPDVVDTLNAVRIDTIPAPGDGVLRLNGVAVIAGQIIPSGQVTNLTFTPDLNESGIAYNSFTFSVQDNNGGFDATPNTMTLNVDPISDAPIVTTVDIRGVPGDLMPVTITTTAVDTDGSEILDATVILSGIPTGVALFGPGGAPIAVVAGSATILVADLGDISLQTPSAMRGVFTLQVSSSSTDAPAVQATTLKTFEVLLGDPFGPPALPADTPLTDPVPENGPDTSGDPGTGTPLGETPSDSPLQTERNSLIQGYNIINTRGLSDVDDGFRDIARVQLYLTGTIDDRLMIVNEQMSVSINKNVFRHTDPSENLTYEAISIDGGSLPNWLEFDAEKLSFSGVPPEGSPKALEITIIAKDSNGNEARATFKIVINRDVEGEVGAQEQSLLELLNEQTQEHTEVMMMKPAFADQLSSAGRVGQIMADQAFIDSLNLLDETQRI